jgi:hypothetical protein
MAPHIISALQFFSFILSCSPAFTMAAGHPSNTSIRPAIPNVACLIVLSLLLGGDFLNPFLDCPRYWHTDRAVSSVIFLLSEINDL